MWFSKSNKWYYVLIIIFQMDTVKSFEASCKKSHAVLYVNRETLLLWVTRIFSLTRSFLVNRHLEGLACIYSTEHSCCIYFIFMCFTLQNGFLRISMTAIISLQVLIWLCPFLFYMFILQNSMCVDRKQMYDETSRSWSCRLGCSNDDGAWPDAYRYIVHTTAVPLLDKP